MQIATLTLYANNYSELADIVLPNLEAYCNRHGYTKHILNIDVLQDNSYGFEKMKLVKEILPYFDLIFCIDIDTLITNHFTKIESFIDDEHDLFITEDINGINCGALIIKNTKWANSFMGFILDQKGTYENEQDVITAFRDLPKIKVVPQPCFNSMPYEHYNNFGKINSEVTVQPTRKEGNWHEGDFLIHVPALDLKKRIEILTNTKITL